MNKVYIVSACRTPVGRFLGALKTVSAVELAALTVRHNLQQAGIDPAWIDEVICGCVLAAGQGMGPARQVALRAGIPVQKPAYTLNMICGSGMKSLTEGAIHIQSGYADLVVAGGMENMSQAPFLLRGEIRGGMKFGAFSSEDVIQRDGLTDPLLQIPMGETAETIAAQEQISRGAQDQYALESHHKASAASRAGFFVDEMVPVTVSAKRGVSTVREDEPIRHDLSAEQLAALKPAFRADGSVTAGNASGLNDGAASVILASARAVARYGLQPLAEIVSFGEGGVDPSMMGLGPAGDQRSLCRAGAGGGQGTGQSASDDGGGDCFPAERPWRRDRPRPPAGQFRDADCGQPGARAAPGESTDRPGVAVHRRRDGDCVTGENDLRRQAPWKN